MVPSVPDASRRHGRLPLQSHANTEWAYPTSIETDAALALARQASLIPERITRRDRFRGDMTTLTFHLSRALGRRLSPGDEIIVTELDHHANIDPWIALAKDRDLRVRTVKMIPETGQLDWDDFSRSVNGRTRIVAMGAASNALGTINDVRAATEVAHEVDALMFVDAVHYAPHCLPDVRAIAASFLACSAYKSRPAHWSSLRKSRLLEAIDFRGSSPRIIGSGESGDRHAQPEGIGVLRAVDFFAR